VLLKNDGVLPLSPTVRRIAVIGPSANDPVALLGNYNGISSRQVTPLEGLERQFPAAQVRYALGATYTASTHALVPSTFLTTPDGGGHGVLAEYFDNPDLQGEPKLRRAQRAYFETGMEDPAVIAAIGREKYSLRWKATLTPPATGEYDLTLRTGPWNFTAKARLFLDDNEVTFGSGPSAERTSTPPPPGPRRPPHSRVALEAGRRYALRVEYTQPRAGGTLQLGWIPPAGAAVAEAEALV
jgi:beta-glucosidase